MFIVSVIYIIYKKIADAFGDSLSFRSVSGFPSESSVSE
jgi:hypothetical protein